MKRYSLLMLACLAATGLGGCRKEATKTSALLATGAAKLKGGDLDGAIAAFDTVIAREPGIGGAWMGRGLAYRNKRDYQHAIADYTRAISLSPNDARTYNDRGVTYVLENDFASGVKDFDRAIQINPSHALAIKNRGRAHFYLGEWDLAARDLERGLSLDTTNAYVVIWLHLARRHLKQDDSRELAARAARTDSTHWPAPILRYFQGKLTADELRAASENTDSKAQKDQRCAVAFYLGESALLEGKHDDAKALFSQTRASCPKDFTEYSAAISELKRLGDG